MPADITPPPPEGLVSLAVSGIPIRLWWKLHETAQRQNVTPGYLVFKILAEVLDYNPQGESYDLLLSEMREHLGVGRP